MPVAPYTVVNIVAGASHIRFTDFLLGTLLGMVPGILAIAGIVDRGYALFRKPDLFSLATSLAVLALILGAWFLIRKNCAATEQITDNVIREQKRSHVSQTGNL